MRSKSLLSIVMSLVLAVSMTPCVPKAALGENIAIETNENLALNSEQSVSDGWSQTGTCEWQIDASGCLTIRPLGNGERGTMGEPTKTSDSPYAGGYYYAWPWNQNRDAIKSLKFEGGVTAGTTLKSLCYNCRNLVSVDFSNLDTSNVKDMSDMFFSCSSVASLDLSDFDTSMATDMSGMFTGCANLATLEFGANFVVSSSKTLVFPSPTVTASGVRSNGSWGLGSEYAATQYTASQLQTLGENKGALEGVWYAQAYSSEELEFGWTYDIKQETNGTYYAVLKEYIGNDTDVVAPAKASANGIDYPVALSLSDGEAYFLNLGCIENLKFADGIYVGSGGPIFNGNKTVKSINCSNLDTSRVSNMSYMFSACSSLSSLDLSGFDTSKVTSMVCMFNGCGALTSLDLSGFDTSKVTGMMSMFHNCSALTELDLSNFDTSNVEDMWQMFTGCSSLKYLDVSSFNTSKVQQTQAIFSGCSSLTSIDISNWDTSKVQDFDGMFLNCSSLTSLDLSTLDMSAEDAYGFWMFNNCTSLTSITLNDHFVFTRLSDGSWASPFPTPEGANYTGKWISSADGKAYAPDEIPEGVAATYTAETKNAPTPQTTGFTRLSGEDRYGTMAAVVGTEESQGTLNTIYLTSGQKFPDALASAGLAGTSKGTIVLTTPDTLSSQAQVAINAAGANTRVVIVGGTSTVSTAVQDQVAALVGTGSVSRIAGNTRTDTAVALYKAAKGSWGTTAIIASGYNSADSLSVSSYAYVQKAPIFLAEEDGTLSHATRTAIEEGGFTNVIIVGGTRWITEQTQASLGATRIAGDNRYETSALIAQVGIDAGMGTSGMVIASGEEGKYPDALAGGSLAGRSNAVMLLVSNDQANNNFAASFIKANNVKASTTYLLGGTGTISAETASYLAGFCVKE